MATVIIPTTPIPSAEFTIDLDGETVRLNIRWNATTSMWVMDLEGITFDTTINGIGLLPGLQLLEPYAIRELGQLWIVDLEDMNAEPTFDDFGDRFQLMYVEK